MSVTATGTVCVVAVVNDQLKSVADALPATSFTPPAPPFTVAV